MERRSLFLALGIVCLNIGALLVGCATDPVAVPTQICGHNTVFSKEDQLDIDQSLKYISKDAPVSKIIDDWLSMRDANATCEKALQKAQNASH
jgi:hypothetical protein